jgi:hypothetical protein
MQLLLKLEWQFWLLMAFVSFELLELRLVLVQLLAQVAFG